MKKLTKSYLFLLFAVYCMGFAGCSGESDPEVGLPHGVKYEMLKKYSLSELKFMEAVSGLNLIDEDVTYKEIHIYKVSVESDHPGKAAEKVNLSGLLIVPPREAGREYRQVVVPMYTYVLDDEAPTLHVKNGSPDFHTLFWLMVAFNHGYAVMIPDYPGHGDSFGQCYIPYMDKTEMVRTTLDYVNASRAVLAKKQYGQKGGFILSGYSLGAFVAVQVARELETNDAYKELPVDLLFTGGTPCDLLRQAELIRADDEFSSSYLYPLLLLGYKENNYPHLNMSDYLKEPYASEAINYLDGSPKDYGNYFPKNPQELFTENFLNNTGQGVINEILEENSVKTWENRCKFIMFHSPDDEITYYDQAAAFVQEQQQHGEVTLIDGENTHTAAALLYFSQLNDELAGW
ncbi:MAG: alpha/beta hydrolase [Dysgonamonadaceae bacterium]|nr:alpha/beta hydrolase [Dysgonamonadaceae bacterium]